VSFFDKVKKGAGDVADKAKTQVDKTQLKNDLVTTYELIGKKTYELADKGEIEHAELTSMVKHVRELRGKLEKLELS
jgi:hypothetical protein